MSHTAETEELTKTRQDAYFSDFILLFFFCLWVIYPIVLTKENNKNRYR